MFDKPHEECGVFGIYNKNQFNAVHLTYLALYALLSLIHISEPTRPY